jgi:protoporphyrinogen oxidase
VVVVEASPGVGGRILTSRRDRVPVELGMKYVPTGCRTLGALLAEFGLAQKLEDISPWLAIVRQGDPHRVRWDRPMALRRSGLLSVGEWLRGGVADVFSRLAESDGLDLDDFLSWGELDDRNARVWSRKTMGVGFTRAVCSPVFGGMYFQSLEEVSRAALLWSIHHGRVGRLQLLPGGLDQLPKMLALGLDVRLAESVLRVDESAGRVRVETVRGSYDAKHVVVGTPGPIALELTGRLRPVEEAFLGLSYSSTAVMTFMGLGSLGTRPELLGIHGIQYAAGESKHIAAISVESGMRQKLWPTGQDTLQVFLRSDTTQRLKGEADEALVAVAAEGLRAVAPSLSERVGGAEVQRWPHALPVVSTGRVDVVREYRKSADPRRIFVGDLHGFPSANTAVFSGNWAAEKILLAGRR